MTAYAQYVHTDADYKLTWELRSVNNRYLDGKFRLPDTLRQFEQALSGHLKNKLARGRVDSSLSIEPANNRTQDLVISEEAIMKWSLWQDTIHHIIPNAVPLSVQELIAGGDLFEKHDEESLIDEAILIESYDRALKQLISRRKAEGARLQTVLQKRLAEIDVIVKSLKDNISEFERAHQKKWRARVDNIKTDEIEPIRLHQELALLITKSDISEELDRLGSHTQEFSAALNSEKPVGKRLDFLLQEFNREANTLGAKSIHKDITNASVEMKVLIDQLREQVQNIE